MKFQLSFAALLFLPILAATQTLTGTVTSAATGTPISNARVTIFLNDTSQFHETRTDVNGVYTFTDLGPYYFIFGVAAPGWEYFENVTTGIIGAVIHDAQLAPETQKGQWDIIMQSPEALGGTNSAAMLPNGNIFFCHSTKDPFVFDPVANDTVFVKGDTKIQGCHAVRLLLDGRLLYAGGTDQEIYGPGIRKVKTFDPKTQIWQPLPDMKDYRWYPTLAPLPDGRLLIVGGGNLQNPQRTRSAEIYDPVALTTYLTDSIPIGNEVSPIVMLHDGRLLMTHRPPQVFDPVTETWSLTSDFVQGPRMPNGDHPDHELTLLPGGKVVAIGYKSFTPNVLGNNVEIYHPATNSWTLGQNFAPVRSRPKSILLPDQKILVLAGYKEDPADTTPTNQWGYTALVDLYDPSANSWRRLHPMNLAREYHTTALLLADGRVVTVGGEGQPGNEPPMSLIEAFRPPYLFRGVRPVIHDLSETDYRRGDLIEFDIARTQSPTKVVLMSFAAVTHFMNSGNNRFLDLDFSLSGEHIDAQIPADSLLALPGYYFLFVMVDDIPSVAKIIRILPGLTPVSTSETSLIETIVVFPNPARGSFSVKSESASIRELVLYDMSGRSILQQRVNAQSAIVQTKEWRTGAYFLKIGTEQGEVWRKVLLVD